MNRTQLISEIACLEFPAFVREVPGGFVAVYETLSGTREAFGGTPREAIRMWGNDLKRNWPDCEVLWIVWSEMLGRL